MSQSEVRPLRRYASVAQEILDAIAEMDLEPGARLPSDREWAQTLGVSRPTVREAILALELAGQIEVRHGDGVYLQARELDIEQHTLMANAEPAHLVQARLFVEPDTARGAARLRLKSERRQAWESLSKAEALVDDDDSVSEFVRLGLTFHVDIARATGNPLMVRIVDHLVSLGAQPLWRLVNQNAMRTAELRTQQVEEHRGVLESIERGDGDSAYELMKAHLQELNDVIYFARHK